MNEKLVNTVISLLESLKTGVPQSWEILVRETKEAALYSLIVSLILLIILSSILTFCIKNLIKNVACSNKIAICLAATIIIAITIPHITYWGVFENLKVYNSPNLTLLNKILK